MSNNDDTGFKLGTTIVFQLVERTDRNNETYFFAGIKPLNAVLFLREEPTTPGEPRRFNATLKPYDSTRANNRNDNQSNRDPYSQTWDEETGEMNNVRQSPRTKRPPRR